MNRIYGWTLILGSLGAVFTMVLHPTGGSLEHLQKIATLAIGIHTLAIASMATLFLGSLGIAANASPFLGRAGLVAYGLASLSGIGAAIMNGLVTPSIALELQDSTIEYIESWKPFLHFSGHVGHMLTRIFIVASGVAFGVWSLSWAKSKGGWRFASWLGIILGLAGIVWLASGGLHINVHDVSLIVFGQAVWLMWMGILLIRSRNESQALDPNS